MSRRSEDYPVQSSEKTPASKRQFKGAGLQRMDKEQIEQQEERLGSTVRNFSGEGVSRRREWSAAYNVTKKTSKWLDSTHWA